MENEKWKDIFGYEGIYQVSDLGRVRSKKYGDWRVLRPSKSHKGYLKVDLSKKGRRTRKVFFVHRLVASAFIPNDNIFNDQVNHINEVKTDNRAVNLEWCTVSYNLAYNGLQQRRYHPKYKRDRIKELYDPNLTHKQNLELFKSNGIECSTDTIRRLRRDLGLINRH